MKKVLLTGASGFIGRHVIPSLLKRGYEVHAVINSAEQFSRQNVFYHRCDLLESKQISQLIETVKPSHLLHLAWYAIPGKFWNSPANLDWVKASIDLLQQFEKHGGKRVVFAGTCAEYDWSSGFCSENETPLNPNTLYGISKAALSKIFNSYTQQIGLSSAWGRVFFLYGPHESPLRLVPMVINNLLRNEVAKCSHGNQVRDFMHVEDVADAFSEVLDSDFQGNINIASGVSLPLKEIINLIGNKIGNTSLISLGAVAAPANDPPVISADTKKLFQDLQWQPKYTIETGLDHAIDWWKSYSRKEMCCK